MLVEGTMVQPTLQARAIEHRGLGSVSTMLVQATMQSLVPAARCRVRQGTLCVFIEKWLVNGPSAPMKVFRLVYSIAM